MLRLPHSATTEAPPTTTKNLSSIPNYAITMHMFPKNIMAISMTYTFPTTVLTTQLMRQPVIYSKHLQTPPVPYALNPSLLAMHCSATSMKKNITRNLTFNPHQCRTPQNTISFAPRQLRFLVQDSRFAVTIIANSRLGSHRKDRMWISDSIRDVV